MWGFREETYDKFIAICEEIVKRFPTLLSNKNFYLILHPPLMLELYVPMHRIYIF